MVSFIEALPISKTEDREQIIEVFSPGFLPPNNTTEIAENREISLPRGVVIMDWGSTRFKFMEFVIHEGQISQVNDTTAIEWGNRTEVLRTEHVPPFRIIRQENLEN